MVLRKSRREIGGGERITCERGGFKAEFISMVLRRTRSKVLRLKGCEENWVYSAS